MGNSMESQERVVAVEAGIDVVMHAATLQAGDVTEAQQLYRLYELSQAEAAIHTERDKLIQALLSYDMRENSQHQYVKQAGWTLTGFLDTLRLWRAATA
jgi:hypothetical protein